MAQDYAEKKDFRAAYELSERYTRPPAMPEVTSAASHRETWSGTISSMPNDLQYGIDLFFAQRKLGRDKEALKTLLSLAKTPGRPAYILYLEAQIYGEQKEWEKAWQARVQFR